MSVFIYGSFNPSASDPLKAHTLVKIKLIPGINYKTLSSMGWYFNKELLEIFSTSENTRGMISTKNWGRWLFRWESNSWASLSWLLAWFTSDVCTNLITSRKVLKKAKAKEVKKSHLQCEGGQKVGQFAWIDSAYFVPSIVVDLFAILITNKVNCHWIICTVYTSPCPEISSIHPIPIQPSTYSNCCWRIGHIGNHDHQQDDMWYGLHNNQE